MKRSTTSIVSVLTAFLATFALAGAASAAGETASTTFSVKPNKGSLYKAGSVPARWSLQTRIRKQWVQGNPATHTVLPLQKVKVQLPGDLTFHPNNRKTPICPDSKVGPNANLTVPPPTVLARCPKSLIGNGHADLYLAKQNLPEVPPPGGAPQWIDDATLLVFNGGYKAGKPHLKIYGYSYKTNYGVYIDAVLQPNGVLNVDVPWLSQDSAVANFDLSIPGKQNSFQNVFGNKVTIPKGKDPKYARARCSSGSWLLTSSFTLQQRDNGTQEPYGERITIQAPNANVNCVGKPGKPGGKAKFRILKVKGPKRVKRGRKTVYRVRVKNVGGKTAKRVFVKVNGRGVKGKRKAKIGWLKAKRAKTVRLKIRIRGRKGKRVQLKFRVNGKGVHAKVRKMRVRLR